MFTFQSIESLQPLPPAPKRTQRKILAALIAIIIIVAAVFSGVYFVFFTKSPSTLANSLGQTGWSISEISKASPSSSLYYNAGTSTWTFTPPENEEYLTVAFDLSHGTTAGTLDVQDILLVIDGQQEFNPIGYDKTVGTIYGNFTAEAGSVFILCYETGTDQVMLSMPTFGDGSNYSTADLNFVYDVPTHLLDGTHTLQMRLTGGSLTSQFSLTK